MGVDLEKRFATELNRLLDTDRGLELDPRAQARRLEERQEQLRRLLEELTRSYRGAELEASPGKQSLVHEARRLLREVEQVPRRTQDAFAKSPWQPRGETFDDYRVSGLLDVLARVPDEELRRTTLAAADPAVASRVPGDPAPAANAGGHAIWRAAERRAATVYRQAQQAGTAPTEDPVVDEALARIGAGQPLPDAVREGLAEDLGMAFDRVRVHTDAVAAAAARALNASAFTVGEDIFFADGCYAPQTRSGRKLLAHELWHVVQGYQGRTPRTAGIAISQPSDALEAEAAATADRVDLSDRASARPATSEVAPATARPSPSPIAPSPTVTSAGAMLLRETGSGPQAPTTSGESAASEGGGTDGTSSRSAAVRHTPVRRAPNEQPNRTTVGVGEVIHFTAERAGAWTASVDRWGERSGTGTSFQWTAPGRPGRVTITYAPNGGQGRRETVTFDVVAPTSVSFERVRDFSPSWRTVPEPTKIRAGMELQVKLLPLTVSFEGLYFKEGSTDATMRSGFWDTGAGGHDVNSHPASAQWFEVGAGNVVSERDTAALQDVMPTSQDGHFEWVIPNWWSLEATGTGTQLAQSSVQQFHLDHDETLRISKSAEGGHAASVTAGNTGGEARATGGSRVHERTAEARPSSSITPRGGGRAQGDIGPNGAGTGNSSTSGKDGASGGKGAKQSAEGRGGRKPKGAGKRPKDIPGDSARANAAKPGGQKQPGSGGGGGKAGFSGGGISGEPLKQQLAQFGQLVDGHSNSVVQPAGTGGNPKKDSAEDHKKKVSQYEDGVDGIADMIGDEDAFDDLCGAVFEGDKAGIASALSALRQTKPFHNLSKMWQGALDGGQDSAAMKAAFEREFTSRGFFGFTEQAYRLVRDEAKAAAKEEAEAAAAKKKAKDAARKAAAGKDAADAAKSKAEQAAAPSGELKGGHGGKANAEYLNAAVKLEQDPLPEVAKMATTAELGETLDTVKRHTALVQESHQVDAANGRGEQIWDQFKHGFGHGFKEGFLDVVKWGVVAHFGEKFAGPTVEKLLGQKVPIVGPILMLAFDQPWKADYWKDVGNGFKDGGKQVWGALFDWSKLDHCHSGTDYLGFFCMKLADLFGGLTQILTTISKLVNTLSALALILGAVCIGIGCALAWLGIGLGLITFGGYLVTVGETLGDIGLALMPICLALTAIAAVCRAGAAIWVPADMYAVQLAGMGEASEKFGDQAGQRVGLTTSRTIEEATPNHPAAPTVKGHGAETNAHAEGARDVAKVADATTAANKALESASTGSHEGKQSKSRPAERAAEKPHESKQQERTGHDKSGKTGEGVERSGKEHEGKEHEAEGAGKKKGRIREFAKNYGRAMFESLKMAVSVRQNFNSLRASLRRLPELGNYHEASARGLARYAEQLEVHETSAREAFEKYQKAATEEKARIEHLLEEMKAAEAAKDPELVMHLGEQLSRARESWREAHAEAKHYKAKLEGIASKIEVAKEGAKDPKMPTEEELEGDAAEDNNGSPHSNEEKKRANLREIKENKKRIAETPEHVAELERELPELQRSLEEAKAHKAEVDARSQQQAEQSANDAVARVEADPANRKKLEAEQEVARNTAALERAKELKQQASDIRNAEKQRQSAAKALDKLAGKTVEIEGRPHKIVRIGPEGVVVEPAGGGAARTLPAEAIHSPELPNFAEQVAQLKGAQESLAHNGIEPGANPDDVARDLNRRANGIERQQKKKHYRSPRQQRRWERTKQAAREMTADRAAAEQQGRADAKASNASEVAAADNALQDAQNKLDEKARALAEAKELPAKLEAENEELALENERMRRAKGIHRRAERFAEKGTEGLAGIVDWAAGLFGLNVHVKKWIGEVFEIGWEVAAEGLEQTLELVEHAIHHSDQEGAEGAAEAAADKKEEIAKKSKEAEKAGEEKADASEKEQEETEAEAPETEEANEGGEGDEEAEKKAKAAEAKKKALAAGTQQAMFDVLLHDNPPDGTELLSKLQEDATNAAELARTKHDWAYKCYQAELAVTRLSEEAAQMAEAGKPLHDRTKSMKAPLEKSKGDEAQRKAALQGADPSEVKGADSQMGSLIVEVIGGLGDKAEHLSQKPDGGGVKGDEMARGQDTAASESQERTKQSHDHSDSQRQFLEEALGVRQNQESSVANSIEQLRNKSKEELIIRDVIRERKAQALAEEAAARAEAETNAAAFNANYAKASVWARSYEEKRKQIEEGAKGDE